MLCPRQRGFPLSLSLSLPPLIYIHKHTLAWRQNKLGLFSHWCITYSLNWQLQTKGKLYTLVKLLSASPLALLPPQPPTIGVIAAVIYNNSCINLNHTSGIFRPPSTPRSGFSFNAPFFSKCLSGWRGFTLQATFVLLKLSAGKSGTIQCPSGNHWDTNWSFKIRTSGQSPYPIWVNRTSLISLCTFKKKSHLIEGNQR